MVALFRQFLHHWPTNCMAFGWLCYIVWGIVFVDVVCVLVLFYIVLLYIDVYCWLYWFIYRVYMVYCSMVYLYVLGRVFLYCCWLFWLFYICSFLFKEKKKRQIRQSIDTSSMFAPGISMPGKFTIYLQLKFKVTWQMNNFMLWYN